MVEGVTKVPLGWEVRLGYFLSLPDTLCQDSTRRSIQRTFDVVNVQRSVQCSIFKHSTGRVNWTPVF